MVKYVKYTVVLLVAGCLVYLLGSFFRGIEREIAEFPLLELIQGKGGIELLPLGVDLVLFTATLLGILTITGVAVITPVWFSAGYAILVSLFLTMFMRDKMALFFGGFLLIAISRHLFGAKKEIHLRIQFSPDLISHGRSMVALVLLLVLIVPLYKGSKEFLENKGALLQRVVEEKGAQLIDRQVPRLVSQMLQSEQLSKMLPSEVPLEEIQKEMLSHLPKGAVVVEKAREQAPKIVSFFRDEFRRALKGGLQGFLFLAMLASSLLWPISILMVLARVLSAIAGLLTRVVVYFLIHTGVIKETTESVELKRLIF